MNIPNSLTPSQWTNLALLALAVLIFFDNPLRRQVAPLLLAIGTRDIRPLLFRCVEHTQLAQLRADRDRIALHMEVGRRIKNVSLCPLRFRIGLEIDRWDDESKPLSANYRKGDGRWIPVDTANISKTKAKWRIADKAVWVWPGRFIEVQTAWQESHPADGHYSDRFAVPTMNPLVIVQADDALDYTVAFAGHPEGAPSPRGVYRLRGELQSDRPIILRWQPKAAP